MAENTLIYIQILHGLSSVWRNGCSFRLLIDSPTDGVRCTVRQANVLRPFALPERSLSRHSPNCLWHLPIIRMNVHVADLVAQKPAPL